ncbi:hypothetical protein OSB04_029558 [Centaurea solstitialis]|uniref:HAT C-terminal dimerisation domain-containing protein n=1 Tax=Centaurea solstitialis TaxID=347529 RepID=A0AA38W307_9ASTR|nr:hypothetical protein OSB04_029558 [Centaurea solstitialis]
MVATRKHLSYSLVYRLLKLTLVLLVAAATVERFFSTLKHVKSNLRNKIDGDDVRDGAKEDREAVRDDLVNEDAEPKGDGVKTDERSGEPELGAKMEQKE